MDDVVVRRWRRHGYDRIYVEHPAGTPLGWWDSATGVAHADDETRRALVAALAARHLADSVGTTVRADGEPDGD